MHRTTSLVFSIILIGCASEKGSSPSREVVKSTTPEHSQVEHKAEAPIIHHGIVELAPRRAPRRGNRHGKHFSGIFFSTPEDQFVVSYVADDIFGDFQGRKIEFDGEIYTPEHQALVATHLVPGYVVLSEPTKEDLMIGIGVATKVCGQLVTRTVPKGAKAAGEKRQAFVTGNSEHSVRIRSVPKDGYYRASMRKLLINPKFAPALPSARAISYDVVWLADLESVSTCTTDHTR